MEHATESTRHSNSCWRRNVINRLPLGSKRWVSACKWISLVVSCFGMTIASTSQTFSVWQNSMRATLNQTETESNIMLQVGQVAGTLAFSAGIMYEHWGSQSLVLFGGTFSVATYVILWLATSKWTVFFANNQWLLFTVWFVNGYASLFTYMGSLMPNVHNFAFEHRGKVIGTLDASLSMGPTILSVVYNSAFTDGYIRPGQEGKQNLPGFFVLLAFMYGFVSFVMFFFAGRLHSDAKTTNNDDEENFSSDVAGIVENEVPNEADSKDELGHKVVVEASTVLREETPPNKFSEFPFIEMPIQKAFRRWNFLFFIVQLSLSATVQTVYQGNIATYLRSFNMNQYNLLFTVLNTSLQAVSKFAAGVASDMIAHRGTMPRAVLFLAPYALQTIALGVSMFYGDQFVVMLVTCICVGTAYGVTWCQSPTMLGELFGGKYLASNWGWSVLAIGILGFPYSIAFSAIYEAAIYEPGDIYCFGLQCFTWSFALLAGTSFCSFLMALGLTQNMYRNAAYRALDLANTNHHDETSSKQTDDNVDIN